MDELLEFLGQREFARCEALARTRLASGGEPMLWWFIAHAQIRTGNFGGALDSLGRLAHADHEKEEMAGYFANMVHREQQEQLARADSALLEELREFDFRDNVWTEAEVADVDARFEVAREIIERPARAVAGTAVLDDDARVEFSDLRDTHDLIGRHLPVYLHDRATHFSFETIHTVTFAPERMFLFDDLWVPVKVIFRPGAPLFEISARVPALYPGWPDGDDEIRAGRTTLFDHGAGYRKARGQRDFEFRSKNETSMTGLLKIRKLEFEI